MAAVFDTPIRTNRQNLDRVLGAGRPVLMAFESPDCAPCRDLEPRLKALAHEFAGRALVVRVEDAAEGDLAARFGLGRLPTLIAWLNGRGIGHIEGAAEMPALRALMEFLLGGPSPAPASGPSIPLGSAAGPRPGSASHSSRRSEGDAATPNGGVPVPVTSATFPSQVLQSSLPVLVDFWAPWCGPCRILAPIVEEIARIYSGRLRVAKLNTDENPDLAARFGIQGIPTLIFFRNGAEVDRVVGAVPRSMLVGHVEQVLGES